MYNNIAINSVNISDDEVLRYLGYGGQELTEKLRLDILRCKQIIMEKMSPRFVCASFKLEKADERIKLEETNLILNGKDIEKLLENSGECVLMAATLGGEVERAISFQQKISVSDGVIMDAVATAAIEAFCDEIENGLRKIHPVTRRYSCGYGDLPIELQPKFLSVLNAQKTIGVFCNEANIMIPRKSVTAVMGITEIENEQMLKKDCDSCLYNESCNFKNMCRID